MNTNTTHSPETSAATVLSIIMVSVMVCIFTYFMARQASNGNFQPHATQISMPATVRQPAQ